MPQLGLLTPVSDSFEIGEPEKFAWRKSQPLGQGANGFDTWDWPILGDRNRLHLLRPRKPLRYRQFFGMFRPGSLETQVVQEELDHLPKSGARASGGHVEIALRDGAKPRPSLAESPTGSSDDFWHSRLAAKEGSGYDFYEGFFLHAIAAECSNQSHFA